MFKIYPNFHECSIQTFDESKKGKVVPAIFSTHENDLENKLIKINEDGGYVGFSVNGMQPGKRGKNYVTGINAWICEIDNKSKREQKKLISACPLKPSLVIESKNSYHLYWFSNDGSIENRSTICLAICEYFGGDLVVAKDIARVLRVPEFFHRKDLRDPYKVHIVDSNPVSYTEEEMLDAFEEFALPPIKKISSIEKIASSIPNIWSEMASRSNVDMLHYFSGHSFVDGDSFSFTGNSNGTQQIIVGDVVTGCWIDASGMIGSGDRGGPTWIQRVLWYGNTEKKDLLKYVKENLKTKLQHPIDKYSSHYQLEDNIPSKSYFIDTSKSPKLRHQIFVTEYLMRKYSLGCTKDGYMFFYDDASGLRKSRTEEQLRGLVWKEFRGFLQAPWLSDTDEKKVLNILHGNMYNEGMSNTVELGNPRLELNLKDGVLDLMTWQLRPYTPDMYKFHKIDLSSQDILDNWNSNPEKLLEFFFDSTSRYENQSDIIKTIQEFGGQLLLGNGIARSNLFLVGESHQGKSTLCNVYSWVVGEQYYRTIKMNDLSNGFTRYQIFGKTLILDTDVDTNTNLDEGICKQVLEGAIISGSKKYKDEVNFRSSASCVLCANEVEGYGLEKKQVNNRIPSICFHRASQEDDDSIEDTLKKELILIYVFFFKGLRRMISRNPKHLRVYRSLDLYYGHTRGLFNSANSYNLKKEEIIKKVKKGKYHLGDLKMDLEREYEIASTRRGSTFCVDPIISRIEKDPRIEKSNSGGTNHLRLKKNA